MGKHLHFYDGADRSFVQTDRYRVLAAGRFGPRDLRLHITGRRSLRTGKIRQALDRAWKAARQEAAARGQRLFNGKLFSLQQARLSAGRLDLLLGETDYRELVGTNYALADQCPPPAEMLLADGLAVSGLVMTADGYVVYGRRSGGVHADPGKLHVCGGHPDPDALVVPEQIVSGRNLLFTAMRQELQEEFRLSSEALSGLVCRGLIRHGKTLKPELIFDIGTRRTAEEVRELHKAASHRDEHGELFFVPSESDALRGLLEKQHEEFTVPGLAALLFHGMARGFWTLEG